MSEEESKVIQEESEEVDEDAAAMPPPPEKAIDIEKAEEQKLKSKFPGKPQPSHLSLPFHSNIHCQGQLLMTCYISAIGGRPGGGGQSAFLQKRLGKGMKYFDSGDYQMAKQGGGMGRGKGCCV